MWEFFGENPWKFVICGTLAEIGVIIALVKTGRGVLLYLIGLVAAVTIGLVVIERMIVTDAEKIEITLYAAADAAEHNNVPALLDCLTTTATVPRSEIRARLPKFQIDKVSIKNDLTIVVNQLTSPPSARASFHVVVTAGEKSGAFQSLTVPLFFDVLFEREQGKWLINGFEEHDGLHALK